MREFVTMSDVEITITLPGELVERARAIGLNLENQSDAVVNAVEQEIRRREAGEKLLDIAEKLRALPDEEKPSLAEIDEAVHQARTEISSERKANM